MAQDTYHVLLGTRRTTVTVDRILSTVLALKLEKIPETAEAHSAVRTYLQKRLNENTDPGRDYVSQWLREEVLLDLMDRNLSKKYWQWFEGIYLA